jgi:hypothetical protein
LRADRRTAGYIEDLGRKSQAADHDKGLRKVAKPQRVKRQQLPRLDIGQMHRPRIRPSSCAVAVPDRKSFVALGERDTDVVALLKMPCTANGDGVSVRSAE